MNRTLVRELSLAQWLRRAHFLWDDPATLSEEGAAARSAGLVRVYSLRRWSFLRDLVVAACSEPGDLWLCTHINYAVLGQLAALGRARRVAVLLHAAELDAEMSFLKRWALRRAGLVIAVSEFTARKAVALGVRSERIRVLPNAVDDPCPDGPVRCEEPGRPVVLFVGRMDERYKGQMELLDAMVILRRDCPALRLVFVGGGSSLPDWQREAERRDLVGSVEFTGRVPAERLQALYASASVFAMPSENEGFGLVYAEAMAHGLPCIGSDRDAAREVIEEGRTGYCVPAGNAVALAERILELVKSPESRERLGRAGRRRFEAWFSLPRYRERLRALVYEWAQAA